MKPSLRVWSPALAAAFAFLSIGASAESSPVAPSTQRFLISVDGVHVGSASWTTDTRVGGESRTETSTIRTVQARGRASIETRFAVARRSDGSIAYERRFVAGLMSQQDAGRVVGGQIVPAKGATGQKLPADTIYPFELSDRLRDWKPGADISAFVYFDIRVLRAVPATMSECPAAGTSAPMLRCVLFTTQGSPAEEQRWFFDADGVAQRIDTELGDLPMVLMRCTSDCDRVVAQPLDLVGRMTVSSPFRIPQSASQRTIRYVISRRDGRPLVVTGTGDQVVARTGGTAVVTVCRNCGPAATEDAATVAAALRPNPWLQTEHRVVRRLGARAGDSSASIDSRMRRLVTAVQETMRSEVNYMGYTDAVQAIRKRRGGCAEFAAVLAALARSQGIPARVVVGLAYSDRFSGRKEVFSPHAWVQVYDGGRWVSYDAALGDFDATHIALAVGDGSPDEMHDAFAQMPYLVIERAGVVKTP